MHRLSRDLHKEIGCVVLLIVLAVGFFWQAALTGRVLLPADVILAMRPWKGYGHEYFPEVLQAETPLIDPVIMFYPWRAQVKQTIADGRLPLWNPDLLCGTPLAANNSSAAWYPPNLLFYVLPLATAWTWCIILHFAMAGVFMFLFLRGIGANRPGAMLGGIAWMFNGWHVAWAEYQTVVCVLVWLPLILLCAERAITRGRYGWAIAGGAAYAMQFLGGHAQYALFSTFLILCYCAARIASLSPPYEGGGRGRCSSLPLLNKEGAGGRCSSVAHRIGVCIVMFAIAGLISAIQILPSAELARVNHRRGGFDYAAIRAGALPVQQIGMLFSPNLWGGWGKHEHAAHRYQGSQNWIEFSAYVGLAPILLAIVGVFFVRKWHARFFAVFALTALLIALGTPLMWLFYHVFPGATQMPSIPRILSLWTFCIAVLAGLSVSCMGEWSSWVKETARRRLAFDIGLIVAVTVPVVVLAPQSHPWVAVGRMSQSDWSTFVLTQMVIVMVLFVIWRVIVRLGTGDRAVVCAWLLCALTAADLFGFFSGWNPAKDRGMLYPETKAIFQAREIEGSGRIISLPGGEARGFLSDVAPNMGLLYGFIEVQGADSLFYKRTKEFWNTIRYGHPEDPKGEFPNEVRFAELPPTDLLKWLRVNCVITPRDDLGSTQGLRCVGGDDDGLMTVYEIDLVPDTDTKWTRMNREILDWRTPSANSHTFRITTDRSTSPTDTRRQIALPGSFYPGWRATVDGAPIEVHPAEHAFCGVAVSPGTHTIELSYRPQSFRLGAFLSLLGLSICTAACTFSLTSRWFG